MTRHALGLHTQKERDYAEGIADQAFARGLAVRGPKALLDLAFEIGILHAIYLLATQEKQYGLARHVSGLKVDLEHIAKRLNR